jgi:hypothetical protein
LDKNKTNSGVNKILDKTLGIMITHWAVMCQVCIMRKNYEY